MSILDRESGDLFFFGEVSKFVEPPLAVEPDGNYNQACKKEALAKLSPRGMAGYITGKF